MSQAAVSEAIANLERIARPVEPGRFSQEGAAGAVEHALDDLVLGIPVLRIGILV